jgi:TolB protein
MMMRNYQKIQKAEYFIIVSMLAGVLLTIGCQAQPKQEPQPKEAQAESPPPPPEPSLETPGDAHLTLFGELPEKKRIPFHAQAASPMQQHSFAAEGADFDVDVSPDGKQMVFTSTRHTTQPNLYFKAINGRAVTQLTADPFADVQPCFSPDGKKVVFASNRSGQWDLWLKNIDRGPAIQVTDSRHHEVHPSFSPDGNRLVYCLFNPRAEQWELWILHLNKPGSKRMIGVGLFPEWSPVEDSIVYQKARQRGGRWFSIWRIDLKMGEPQYPVELAASSEMAFIQPSWSPDGQWITYGTAKVDAAPNLPDQQTSRTTCGDIWIMRKNGTSHLKMTDNAGANFSPVWSPENQVFFTSVKNGTENIWSVTPVFASASNTGKTARQDNINSGPVGTYGPQEAEHQGG